MCSLMTHMLKQTFRQFSLLSDESLWFVCLLNVDFPIMRWPPYYRLQKKLSLHCSVSRATYQTRLKIRSVLAGAESKLFDHIYTIVWQSADHIMAPQHSSLAAFSTRKMPFMRLWHVALEMGFWIFFFFFPPWNVTCLNKTSDNWSDYVLRGTGLNINEVWWITRGICGCN